MTSPTRPSAAPSRRRARLLGGLLSCAIALPAGLASASAAQAADEAPAPTAHYDMSHSGTVLTDVSGNGRDASLTGFGDASFVNAGGDAVLRFRADGYAALPHGLVTAADNAFTVEYTVSAQKGADQFGWVLGDGVGPWNTTQLGNHVFINPLSTQGGYTGQVLSGIRVKRDGGNGEVRLPAGGGLNPGFTTLTMVGDGNRLTLFRDGVQLSTATHPYTLGEILPSGAVLGYLGRSLYQGDALLTADVTDVKFWDAALTPAQVQAAQPSAAEKRAATEELLKLDLGPTLLAKNPAFDRITSRLNLPSQVNGTTLDWASSDPAVVSTSGEVSRAIAADTPVTLTATTAGGAILTFELTVLAPSLTADLDAVVLAARSTENLPLPTRGAVEGSSIVWTSSEPALVTSTDPWYTAPAVGSADPYAGGGIVTRPAYGSGDATVTLTATATLNGQTDTRSFEVTVAELGRTAPDAGYAAAYFKADNNERIYAAATTGNDFFSFTEVNGGAPIVDNTADTTGHRDPYILRSQGGDRYYMIATDLCIGCGTGWGPAQSNGSLKINVWQSADMVHWSRTNGDENGGITINQPAAGMTWAPEAYWDDELQSYVVFFASRLYDNDEHTAGSKLYARMFTVLTRDFVTFTEPRLWQDTGYARIDSTVQKIGDAYYRFTKNEEGGAADGLERGKDIFLEKSQVLTAPTTRSDWNADPATGWQLVDTGMTTPVTGQAGEGPEIVKLNAGDPNNTAENDGYVFLVDNYGAGGYRAFVTSGDAIAGSSQSARLSQQPGWTAHDGGLPPSPCHGAFVSVTQQVLDAMHAWSAIEATASTTALSASGRTVTARVVAADGGDVAGTVTFRSGDWSRTVPVSAAAPAAAASSAAAPRTVSASIEVPIGLTGVSASYDGYTDGLVAPSAAEPVTLADDGTSGGSDDGSGGTPGTDGQSNQGSGSTDSPHPGALPLTGSAGTGALIGAGALLVLAAGALLVAARRRVQNGRE